MATAIAPASTYDFFGRTVSTWTTSDSGHAWGGDDDSYWNVGNDPLGNGPYGKIAVSASSFPTYDTAYHDLSASGFGYPDVQETLTLIKWGSLASPSNPATDGGPMIMRESSNTFYFVRIMDNLNAVAIACYADGQLIELERANRTLTPDTWYWVRFQHSETGFLKVRMWAESASEPSSWLVQTNRYTGDGAPQGGDWGFAAKRAGDNHTYYLRAFYGYTYGAMLGEEIETLPTNDTFARDTREGWGLNNLKQPWEGNVAIDPGISRATEGNVASGNANWTVSDDIDHVGFNGPAKSGDAETLARIGFNSSAGTSHAYIGLRGVLTRPGRAAQYSGYAVRVTTGGTTLTLWKKNAPGDAWLQITATPVAHTALNTSDSYNVRFQMINTTLSAKIWRQGDSEPGSWNVTATDATITGAGRGFISWQQNTGITATRTLRLYSFVFGSPTYSGTLHTTIGAVTQFAVADTTTTLRAAFTNDTDSDNSAAFRYRVWTGTIGPWATGAPLNTTITRNSTYFNIAITGLTKNTTYEYMVTFSDPDGISGTNPQTGTFSTSNSGLTTGDIFVDAVGANSVDIRATYTEDINDDSTATLAYRLSSANVQNVNDTFAGGSGTTLQTHVPDLGEMWFRHPLSATKNIQLWQGRIYAATTTDEEEVYYYNDTTPGSAEYDVCAQFYVAEENFLPGIMARLSKTLGNYYLVRYNPDLNRLELIRGNNGGASTTLATFNVVLEKSKLYGIMLRVRDAYKSVYLDDVQVMRSTDNTHTSAGVAGVYFKSPAAPAFSQAVSPEGSYYNQINVDNFEVDYRIGSGSYVSAGSMTANRTSKHFTATASGLTTDTVYEFRVTFADAVGVDGINPLYITAQTVGSSVTLTQIIASPKVTSAIVEAVYDYDTNNNSSLVMQYRSTIDHLWTNVPSERIIVSRGTKRFYTTLNSLKPSTTYQIKATISDANGIVDGGDAVLTELFTTDGVTYEDQKKQKHYLWKVYDRKGFYISTWHDAPEPEFSWHENGGVSDLRAKLNRPLSSLQSVDSGVDYQNRIDIWCLDPSSDGFGPNMIEDYDFELGSWTLNALSGGTPAHFSISSTGGPDDGAALKLDSLASATVQQTWSPIIPLFKDRTAPNAAHPIPVVIKCVAKARGGKLRISALATDIDEEFMLDGGSEDFAETLDNDWQVLRFEFSPPSNAFGIRIIIQNDGQSFGYVDKVEVRAKEALVYRGRIESFTPQVDQNGESIELEVLGLVSLLSDDYIDFLQFVDVQPEGDVLVGRINYHKQDPADMLKMVINQAQRQNPECALYYDDTSIQPTGIKQGYTFRDQQIRACFDKIRNLCPSGWHYFVEPDGRVVLRGPEHAATHKLRIGVEVMNFSVERSIRNLKNYIHVKGRQDDDGSELDGEGSIHYIAFDQNSIDKYGKRMMFIRDAQITDHVTAELFGDGRLEEYNKEEQRAQCLVPDEKSISYTSGALRGYNIESFRPGDNVTLFDPAAGPRNTYWDSFLWDDGQWDSYYLYTPLPETVPIKTVQIGNSQARIELSERQPNGTGDFGRLMRWLQSNSADTGEG